MSKVDEMGAGAVMGFQVPMGIKKRKAKMDELLAQNPDIGHGHILMYLKSLDEPAAEKMCGDLDGDRFDMVADSIRDHVLRELVKQRVKEIVRKKPGGGGYVLYSPNKGKKRPAKAVGHFPTQAAAKRAELARFPPKDVGKLGRLRKQVTKLVKNPKKKETKKESLEFLRPIVSVLVLESLFREERTGSDWDQYISRLSNQALSGDKKFQKLQQNIEKKTHVILQDAFESIRKSIKKDVKLKSFGIKKNSEKGGKTYLPFEASIGNATVGPIYVYVENGVPKIEVSDSARVALTKANPDEAKLFRAELVTVQERVLDNVSDLISAIEGRDHYLEKIENEVDGFVSKLTPLQVSMLKQLLVKKYRKIT